MIKLIRSERVMISHDTDNRIEIRAHDQIMVLEPDIWAELCQIVLLLARSQDDRPA